MDEMVFQVVKIVVMVVALFMAKTVLPLVKAKIGTEKLVTMEAWTRNAVLYAQQWFDSETGAKKKQIVLDILRDVRDENNINITDEQMEILLESAVKQMKMEDLAGVTVDTEVEIEETIEETDDDSIKEAQ